VSPHGDIIISDVTSFTAVNIRGIPTCQTNMLRLLSG